MDNDNNDNNTKKPRKEYVTKQQKADFIQWYLKHYGYNIKKNNRQLNSRILSETYQATTGILIPKITIYRWLNKLNNEGSNIVDKFVSVYVVKSFR